MEMGDVKIHWLGHSGFLIEAGKKIYIDPFQIREGSPLADVVLLTHHHYDHCSFEDLKKIVRPGTLFILTPDCQSKIMKLEVPVEVEVVNVGDELDFNWGRVLAVRAYNVDKDFHRKEEGLVGYVLRLGNIIIYHAGDTDFIQEMQKLTGFNQEGKTFVALLPVSGRYVMNPEEAFRACEVIKPSIAIPMHYGSIVGGREEAEEFCELCREAGFECRILERE